METVWQTVAAHGAGLDVLDIFTSALTFVPTTAAAATTPTVTAVAIWRIFLVGNSFGELGDTVQHDLDLCGHCIHHHFCAVMDVGGLFFLGDCCFGNPCNVLLQFVAVVGLGCLICTFVAVFASCATAVLHVDFLVPDEPFKVGHRFD
jgi:hypothetical protein